MEFIDDESYGYDHKVYDLWSNKVCGRYTIIKEWYYYHLPPAFFVFCRRHTSAALLDKTQPVQARPTVALRHYLDEDLDWPRLSPFSRIFDIRLTPTR